jgi:hypothetical protein
MDVAAGCSHFVNPWTVVQIVTYAKAHGAPAIVNTGGASALGQMLLRLCRQEGVPLLSVVRTDAQVRIQPPSDPFIASCRVPRLYVHGQYLRAVAKQLTSTLSVYAVGFILLGTQSRLGMPIPPECDSPQHSPSPP